MSKIVIFAKNTLDAKSIQFLHKITGASLLNIKKSQESGLPIQEYILFENDYKDIAERLKLLVDKLDNSLDFYEIEDDFIVNDKEEISQHRISKEVLLNIISSADEYE